MFYCCFVRFVVLLSALCYSNWLLNCILYIGLSLPSIEVEFIPSIWHKIAMSTVVVSEHFFLLCFQFFFIYSSAFLGSILWCLPFFPTLISCLSLLESPFSHVSFQFSFGLTFLISFSCFLLCLDSYTWLLVIGCDWWCYEV